MGTGRGRTGNAPVRPHCSKFRSLPYSAALRRVSSNSSVLQMFEVGEEGHIELDATLVDVDTDVLVGGMDELACFAGVDKAAEAIDAIADIVELARVGAGILHEGAKLASG